MRILIVTPHYWPEPFRVPDVASGLQERGHQVEVLTTIPDYPAGRFYEGYGISGPCREERSGILITRVPVIPRGRGGAIRLVLNYASFALASAFAASWIGRRRWDVVFVFQLSPVTAILPALVVRALHRVPIAIWVQDLWPESVLATGVGRSRALFAIVRAISGWLYRRCDRVMATSRAFLPRLARLGVPEDRLECLPQWAESFFDSPRGGAPLPGGPWAEGFPIMFAGNLGRVQALDTVLEAADLLRDDMAVRWVFIGDGSMRDWLQGEVARRGLREKVFLLGRRAPEEMPSFYAKAAAMLVSLKADDTMALTVPAKVQSYLAAGRPIVGSIDGEAARVIEESGAGWTSPAGDPDGLARLVRRMKELPESERVAMGRRGREYSEAHFARERCLDQLERVLTEAAALRDVTPAATPSA